MHGYSLDLTVIALLRTPSNLSLPFTIASIAALSVTPISNSEGLLHAQVTSVYLASSPDSANGLAECQKPLLRTSADSVTFKPMLACVIVEVR